jgi:hypothetical protein
MNTAEHDVAELVSHYIDEVQLDRRGVKEGWYAMDESGQLTSGPFPNRESCPRSCRRRVDR